MLNARICPVKSNQVALQSVLIFLFVFNFFNFSADPDRNKRPTSAASSSDGCQTPLRPTSSSGRSSSCSSRMSDFLAIDQKQKDLNELERLGSIIR